VELVGVSDGSTVYEDVSVETPSLFLQTNPLTMHYAH